MRDIDVRRALHKKVLREHRDEPDTLVLDELGLCNGDARVDVAVINGEIRGYEIKSEKDTLVRLPHQVEVYNSTLDRVVLVVFEGHLEKALPVIPTWWGVKTVRSGPRGAIHFEEIRRPLPNPAIDIRSLVTLLWKDEVLSELERMGQIRGLRNKPKRALYDRLADALSVDEIRCLVRRRLKERERWRRPTVPFRQSDAPQM